MEWTNEKIDKIYFFAVSISHPLWAKAYKSGTTSLHYFFPREVETKRPLNRVRMTDTKIILLSKAKLALKKICAAILHLFLVRVFLIWYQFFPFFFPKESESLKTSNIQPWEVGSKYLNWYLKSLQKDTRTDIST